ncbi:MAG TPA: thiamine phosphate synthase [Acidisarcina sp.]
MKLCAITDGLALPELDPNAGPRQPAERRPGLIELAGGWAAGGVDYIQVREKQLEPSALRVLVGRFVAAVHPSESPATATCNKTKILVNGPALIANEAGADGVHLPGGFSAPAINHARHTFAQREAGTTSPLISVSCHYLDEVVRACDLGVDLILFAPVFGKLLGPGTTLPGVGLKALAAACRAAGAVPVLALGGITAENASQCVETGAAGVAGIRLFTSGDWQSLRDVRVG